LLTILHIASLPIQHGRPWISHVMCGYSAGDKLGLDSLQTCNERSPLVIYSMFETKVAAKDNLALFYIYVYIQETASY